jgi:hypothetical protein
MPTGLFLIFIIDSLVCLALSAVFTKFLRKRFGLDTGSCLGCLASMLLLPLIVMATFYFVVWLEVSHGESLSLNQAKASNLTLKLPEAASDIDYYQSYHQIIHVDFVIGEKEFIGWVHSLGMDPQPISDEGEWVSPLRKTQNNPVHVTHGFYSKRTGSKEHPGNRYPLESVVYDKTSNRAYYRHSAY